MSATLVGVVPSGECLWGEGLVQLIGMVVCLLAAWCVVQHHQWPLPISCHFQDCTALLDVGFSWK